MDAVLETNEWMVLNNLIYKIYSTENPQDLQEALLSQLRLVMDYDRGDFSLSEEDRPATYLPSSGSIVRMPVSPNLPNHCIQLILGKDETYLGELTLYRGENQCDFRKDDVMILNMLKDHLTLRLFQEQQKRSGNKMTISEAVDAYHLTKQERVILTHLLAGDDNDSICDQLVISINTLKKHILNIYRKLGIRNRVQMFKMIYEG